MSAIAHGLMHWQVFMHCIQIQGSSADPDSVEDKGKRTHNALKIGCGTISINLHKPLHGGHLFSLYNAQGTGFNLSQETTLSYMYIITSLYICVLDISAI